MNKRIKQASFGSLFVLMWLMLFSTATGQASSLLHTKSAIQKNAPVQKGPSFVLELKENLEEESEDSVSDRSLAQSVLRLFSLLLPAEVAAQWLQVDHRSKGAPDVGLFILYCSLRIPSSQLIG